MQVRGRQSGATRGRYPNQADGAVLARLSVPSQTVRGGGEGRDTTVCAGLLLQVLRGPRDPLLYAYDFNDCQHVQREFGCALLDPQAYQLKRPIPSRLWHVLATEFQPRPRPRQVQPQVRSAI